MSALAGQVKSAGADILAVARKGHAKLRQPFVAIDEQSDVKGQVVCLGVVAFVHVPVPVPVPGGGEK